MQLWKSLLKNKCNNTFVPKQKKMVFKNGTLTKMPHLSNSKHYMMYDSIYAVF